MTKSTSESDSEFTDIYGEVSDFMSSLADGRLPSFRYPEFRASSFPFCPILFALQPSNGRSLLQSDFYFTQGTAMHELVQGWASIVADQAVAAKIARKADPTLPKPDNQWPKLYGDWRCVDCNRYLRSQTYPTKECQCRNTKGRWVYEELTIEWAYTDTDGKTHAKLSGHVDCVLQTKYGKFIVVDFKTTDMAFDQKAENRFPYKTNIEQIKVYCALLRETYNLDIVGWSLVYLDRSKPPTTPLTRVTTIKQWTPKDHKKQMGKLVWASKSAALAQVIQKKLRAGEQPTKEDWNPIVECRPCPANYESYMQSKFKYDTPAACPNLDICSGSDKKCTKGVVKLSLEWTDTSPPV
jgi:hypothetical protein